MNDNGANQNADPLIVLDGISKVLFTEEMRESGTKSAEERTMPTSHRIFVTRCGAWPRNGRAAAVVLRGE